MADKTTDVLVASSGADGGPHSSLARNRMYAGFRRAGFTLRELSLILVVLGAMMAMLMPALAKARRQARVMTCLSNLRVLQQSLINYQQRNGGSGPAFDKEAGLCWLRELKPTLSDPSTVLCPEAMLPSYGWGSATRAWGPYDAVRSDDPTLSYIGNLTSSYAMNGWLYSRPGSKAGSHEYRFPDRVCAFGDANWCDAFPLQGDELPTDGAIGAKPGQPELGRFYLSRHNGAVNISFMDGHAEQTPLDRLKSFRFGRHGPNFKSSDAG